MRVGVQRPPPVTLRSRAKTRYLTDSDFLCFDVQTRASGVRGRNSRSPWFAELSTTVVPTLQRATAIVRTRARSEQVLRTAQQLSGSSLNLKTRCRRARGRFIGPDVDFHAASMLAFCMDQTRQCWICTRPAVAYIRCRCSDAQPVRTWLKDMQQSAPPFEQKLLLQGGETAAHLVLSSTRTCESALSFTTTTKLGRYLPFELCCYNALHAAQVHENRSPGAHQGTLQSLCGSATRRYRGKSRSVRYLVLALLRCQDGVVSRLTGAGVATTLHVHVVVITICSPRCLRHSGGRRQERLRHQQLFISRRV